MGKRNPHQDCPVAKKHKVGLGESCSNGRGNFANIKEETLSVPWKGKHRRTEYPGVNWI